STKAVEAPTATKRSARMGMLRDPSAKANVAVAKTAMPSTSTIRRPIRSASTPTGYAATALAALWHVYRSTAIEAAAVMGRPSLARRVVARRMSNVAEKFSVDDARDARMG